MAVATQGMVTAARRVAPFLIAVVLPVLAFAQVRDLDDRFDTHGFDFRGTLWEPAGKVLDGESPYPLPTDGATIVRGNPSVYPPLPIVMAAPLARLGFDAAFAVWVVLLLASVLAALRIVGVRDWRCHALALMSPPVVQALYLGNITLLLMLPLAAAWRWRTSPFKGGLAVASAVAIKPFLVPLFAWFLLTRRFLAAAVSLVAGFALLVVPWAVIGFDGLREYPRLLDRLEAAYGPGTDSLPAAFSWLASSGTARQAICLTAGLAFVGLAVHLRRSPNGDLSVYTLMIGASVVATPIVWPHYLALLLVPLGAARPRWSAVWLLPYALPLALAIDDRVLRAWMFLLLMLLVIAVPVVRKQGKGSLAS